MSAERKIEATTSAWLGNPEQAFYVLGEVNKELHPDNWVGLEIYPVAHKSPISERTAERLPLLNRLVNAGYGFAFRDGRVSSEELDMWRTQYKVPIERIHLPFHYSIPTGAYNYVIHSVFKERGTLKDRGIATVVAYMMMTAMNNVATRLAEDFDAGLNAHVNIIEEAQKRGKVNKIVGEARYVRVENDVDYPRKKFEHFQRERDIERALDAVEAIELDDSDGLIYGLDHAYRAMLNPENRDKFDPRDDFSKSNARFHKYLRNIHLAGSKGDHGLIQPDDGEFWGFMAFARDNISDNVAFCLDLDPVGMDAMTTDEQVDYMKVTVKKLKQY